MTVARQIACLPQPFNNTKGVADALCPSAREPVSIGPGKFQGLTHGPRARPACEGARRGPKAHMQSSSVNRRDLLRLALGGVAVQAAGLTGSAPHVQAQSATTLAKAAPPGGTTDAFTPAKVVDLARALAAEPFKPPSPAPLDALSAAAPEDVAAIRYKPTELIWAGDNLAFAVEPLHRSRNLPGEVELYLVDGATAERVAYEPARFDFGKLKPPPASAQFGFTGFRILRRDPDG